MDKRPFRFRHVHKTAVAFVMTAVALVVGAIAYILHAKGVFEPKTNYRIELPSEGTAGLDKGADVMILGKTVGVIELVELRGQDGKTKVKPKDQISPDSIKLVAMLSVKGQYTRFIGEDSEAKLKNGLGGFGAAYIEITRGAIPRTGRGERDGGILPFVVEKGVQDDVSEVLLMVTEKVEPLLDSLTATSESVNELVTSFTSEAGAFQQTLASLEETMEKVNSGDGAVNMILNDDGFRDDLTSTLSNIDKTVAGLKLTVAEIDGVMEQFNSATMPKLNKTVERLPGLLTKAEALAATAEEKLEELDMTQVNSAVGGVDTAVESVPQALDEFAQFMASLQRFPLFSPFVPSDKQMLEREMKREALKKALESGVPAKEEEAAAAAVDGSRVQRRPERWKRR